MLQNKFEMPLDLIVNPSKIFSYYLFTVFFLSFISVFIASLHFSVQFSLFLLLVVSAYITLLNVRKNKVVTAIKLSQDERWCIELGNQHTFEVELYGECIVTYFIVWLNFTSVNRFGKKERFHVLLLPDSMDKNSLRQLRVRLRFLKSEKVEIKGDVMLD